ncbi:hypothetical protein QOZ33_11830 [Pseudomonas aeruginosa]|uniref:hypothetical protein n=1 Tax=Pseudomonas aeruginosa TaxID=287 RepID=UPI00330711B6|nr:hypothetical protein [Pseudomonas aeruginosa]
MNSFFNKYIEAGKSLAESRGLDWDLAADLEGNIIKTARWDLAKLCGLPSPPYFWHSYLGPDSNALDLFNGYRARQGLEPVATEILSKPWRDFYQAVLLNELLVKRNKPGHALNNIGRALRILATCAAAETPWQLSPDTIQLSYNVALSLGSSGKLASNVCMVIRNLIDALHISDRSPLARFCEPYPEQVDLDKNVSKLRKGNNTYRATEKVRTELSERKSAARLPDEKAFWELVRIVFTEKPRTFSDAMRFNQIKIQIACGFRIGENTLLPLDWKRSHDYIAADGRPAGELGGVSRALSIRHFAEKQGDDIDFEGVVLYENTQNIPNIFENLVEEALAEAERLSTPLRDRLRQQIETGRLIPEYSPESIVPAWDIYNRLTGSIGLASLPPSEELVEKYRETLDPQFLELIINQQISLIARYGVSDNCKKYFNKLPITIRRSDGSPQTGKTVWHEAYLCVAEVEDMVRETMPTKVSHTAPFKLQAGRSLPSSELMYLMPIRPLIEERNGGVLDVARYFAVSRASPLDLHLHLGGQPNNIFARYGLTEEDRSLSLNTHSLRHLQNGELFRLGVADTIITKRFNRRSVAQSHVYDHRSLTEALSDIDLPAGADTISPRAQETLRMILANKIRGPIVDEFLEIQKEMGDDVAFQFLSAEADGLHATPYGFCVNSFTVDPCPKHLQCYNGCRHLTRSGIEEENQSLKKLRGRLQEAVELINKTPIESRNIGWQNQLRHAENSLANLDKAISTAPGNNPFPDGPDLYRSVDAARGTTLMDSAIIRSKE